MTLALQHLAHRHAGPVLNDLGNVLRRNDQCDRPTSLRTSFVQFGQRQQFLLAQHSGALVVFGIRGSFLFGLDIGQFDLEVRDQRRANDTFLDCL